MSNVLEVYERLAQIKLFVNPNKMLNSYEPDILSRLIKAGKFEESDADNFVLRLWGNAWECPSDIFQAAVQAGFGKMNLNAKRGMGVELTETGKARRKELYTHLRQLAQETEY